MTTSIISSPITVIGAGSYGTSLAIAFSRNGYPTYLWGHDPLHCERLANERQNRQFLPDVIFPETLHIEADLAAAMQQSRDILVVVPSHVFGEVIKRIKPHLRPEHRIVWATKGLERDTGRLLQNVVEDELGTGHPLAVLSGPTFAKELAAGMPTAIALASHDGEFAKEFQARIHCSKNFRVYINQDMIGVQLGGAIKNVIAISAGMSDGMGFGANARTALITRGLAEISRLAVALGGNPQTLMGLAGLGDLVLTANSTQSRNFTVGLELGKGRALKDVLAGKNTVAEGVFTASAVLERAATAGVEMPICEGLSRIMNDGATVDDVIATLLARPFKAE